MVKIRDPKRELIDASSEATAAEIAGVAKVKAINRRNKPPSAPEDSPKDLDARIREDFRVFLIMLWRHLLGVDPAPIMLDMAWYLQHSPDRTVIMAFRGFSKSWITGAYALWLLYCDPQEKVLIESGALDRAVASTNWCLMLILSWPLLAHLKPKPNQRQSSKAFDVGPATPEQSPSFHAMGIGGQAVGFRASIIIADDVETNTNSITSTMRAKIRDAVKEFDSILKPGGRVKFLGTPHDEESLYNEMPKRGYTCRKWPALYPTAEQEKRYGEVLAPYIISMKKQLGPGCVGQSVMPSRFPNDDLAKRELSLGKSEFALQFMLDTSMSDRERYPLKVHDLMVMSCDQRRAPEVLAWSNDAQRRLTELQPMGFEGDFYFSPAVDQDIRYSPYNRVVAAVDTSGRGTDETVIAIIGELHGTLYLLAVWASRNGFEPASLAQLALLCVQYRVNDCLVESNFGDGMFAALFRPVLEKAWKRTHQKGEEEGGTQILEIKVSNQLQKERRILSILEPVTQQHRLVVDKGVIEWDLESIQKIDGEDGRHRYSLFHQLTHLTRERECLDHDDRIDALATAVGAFADILGVDPGQMAVRSSEERDEEEYEKLFGDLEEDDRGLLGQKAKQNKRMEALRPHVR
jgi:hypothetical protein